MKLGINVISVDAAKDCGACSLCCKLLAVEATDSLRGEWCRHCSPQSRCGIYEKRPTMCSQFECGWLESQGRVGEGLSAELRPDKCHAVLMPMGDGRMLTVHVDTSQPEAWRTGALGQLIKRSATQATVIVLIGNDRFMMEGDRTHSWSFDDRR